MGNGDFGAIVRERMNFIFLIDTSGSMSGQRINQLNEAMPEVLQIAAEVAMDKEVELMIRIIEFNDHAEWILGDETQGVLADEASEQWVPMTAKPAGTNTAEAITLSLDALHTSYLGTSNYHPVVILITDGDSNSRTATTAAIDKLKAALTGGKKKDKVWRIAIGVQDANEDELKDFAMLGKVDHGDGSMDENVPMVFQVEDINQLTAVLKNVTVSSLISGINAGAGVEDDDQEVDPGIVIEEFDDDDEDDFDWEE